VVLLVMVNNLDAWRPRWAHRRSRRWKSRQGLIWVCALRTAETRPFGSRHVARRSGRLAWQSFWGVARRPQGAVQHSD